MNNRTSGISAAFASAVLLGFAPVFGKLAISGGFSPLAVVAIRTSLAAGILFLVMLIGFRKYLYIFPVGLAGCILAGAINGLGSIFYYLSLAKLNAGLGQLLYSLYPFFVAIWLTLDHQPPSRLTFTRIGVASLAVLLLIGMPDSGVDFAGVLMMLFAAMMYALHLPINQRVLFEVPAPTVTLYTLLAMSAVVLPAYLIFDGSWPAAAPPWAPVFGLTTVTLISRITLFLGVKKIGGMQTALLGLAELLIAISFSHFLLDETFTPIQWLGVLFLCASLVLVMFDQQPVPRQSIKKGWLSWIRAAGNSKDFFGPYE